MPGMVQRLHCLFRRVEVIMECPSDGRFLDNDSRFRRLVEDALVVGWEIDLATYRCTYVSPHAVEMLGYPLEEWLCEGFWSAHIHPDDRERSLSLCAVATQSGESQVLEYRMLSADGRIVWIRDLVSVQCENGRPTTLRGVMVDVTERRNIEDALRATVDMLTRSNSELERFAYIASHDLQEPLRTIVGFSQLIDRRLGNNADPEIHEFLNLVVNAGQRMHGLIGDLLAYVRSGGELAPMAEVSLGEIAQVATERWHDAIQGNGGTVDVAALPSVTCDRQRILQVFDNLIGNAVKFRQTERPLRIVVTCEEFDEVVAVSVADNGIGIDQRYLDCVFEAFKRLHHHSDIPGSGIGLAVVRRNVELHGGKVWVESRAGVGSTFHFTLPRAII